MRKCMNAIMLECADFFHTSNSYSETAYCQLLLNTFNFEP